MSTTAKEQPDDTKEPSGASTRPAPKVVHLTEEERSGRGRTAREQTPRTSHALLETDGRDPVAIVDADSAESRAGARADPLRAHARLGVHVLPRRREPDGARPGIDPRVPASTPSFAEMLTARTSAASPHRRAISSST